MKQPVLLRIYRDDQLEGVRQFDQPQIVIGRNSETQLSLEDASVSPLHAVIEERDSGYYISDLGSQSGTIKGGERILDERLESGDELLIGVYKLQFFIGVPKPKAPPRVGAPVAAAPTPTPTPTPSAPASQPAIPKVTAVTQNPVPPSVPSIGSEPPAIDPGIQPKAPITPVSTPKPTAYTESRSGATFAPPSEIKDLNQYLKPGKGTVVEVVVAWKERIIATHHFNEKRTVTFGADPSNDIVVPLVGFSKRSHPLLKIDARASILVTAEMSGDFIREGSITSFADMMRQNRFRSSAKGYELDLDQGEMVRIGFSGDLISVYVRYVSEAPKPLVAPVLDLTASEVTGVILATVVAAIFGLYMMVYAPLALEDEALLEEPIRKAVVTFKPPRPPRKRVEEIPPKATPQKKEKKVVKIVDKKQDQKKASVKQAGKPGKAGEARPKPQNTKPKSYGSVRQGGAIKTGDKSGANAKSQKPDPSKVGLMSVFGSKGMQNQLDKTYSGAGELQGLADSATGYAGQAEDREGDRLGSRIREGSGGRGSQTVGISGVGTKGKGSGNYGYGTGGLGTKGSVDINVAGDEAEFVGSIDKEAIRRVIHANKRAIKFCYDKQLNRRQDLYGKLVLEWDIGEKGRVVRAGIKSNSLGDNEVANCIIGRLKTWRFPEPPPDVIGRVTYPFVFTAQ